VRPHLSDLKTNKNIIMCLDGARNKKVLARASSKLTAVLFSAGFSGILEPVYYITHCYNPEENYPSDI
jgi:hypothetical protein